MSSVISISNHFKSSTRVTESNFDPKLFLDNFIAHGTVLQTIDSIGAELKGTKQRAFTVTGPYGSGKSTLAMFFDCLLSENKKVRADALSKLTPDVMARFQSNFGYANGWSLVKHLCGLSSPIKSIAESILSVVPGFSAPDDGASEADYLEILKQAFDYVSAKNDGLLLIIDEMGKALDYQASVGGDLHFFQSFADLVQQYENIVVIGFLHQSFAAYAKGRDSRTQNEWGKVQGRYKDFGFNPSIEESLYLIGESFKVQDKLSNELVVRSAHTMNVVLSHFGISNATALENILPIDPVTALLLGPISKRSFSQNERSLFSFIATHEKFGFRDYISREEAKSVPFSSLYTTDDLWDYLYNNLGHIISASNDSKAWLEACDSVERAGTNGTELHVSLTKLIALLSMMGRGSGLYASKQFLVDYLLSRPDLSYSEQDIDSAIKLLESKSIIIYRHNLNSFHVFRASDLDINRLVLDWVERVKGGFDWVSSISTEKLVLASAHYHKTGVMRWAEAQVVSAAEQVKVPSGKAGESFLNMLLPTSRELYKTLISKFENDNRIIVGSTANIDLLEKACIELIALQKLAKEESEKLSRDPIAKTEIESREIQATSQIDKILDETLNQAEWSYLGATLVGKSLTAKVSKVADLVYSECPAVHNELVNRMKLSGTSNSALNKLLLAILQDDRESNLGFPEDTFPPEKGIYLGCLKDKGWHTPDNEQSFCGNWFDKESAKNIPANHIESYNLWKSGFDFIKSGNELVVIQDLYDFWMSPPFGLTLGLCKLYAMALLKSLESHLAFYDFDSTKDWIYIPELDEELVNKLWKYPSEAGVRYYELAETDVSLVKEISLASEASSDESILSTARSLVRKMHAIPSWVKRTSGHNLFKSGADDHLDTLTKRFRDRVLSAKDPYKLILEDIPNLFDDRTALSAKMSQCLSSLFEIDGILSSEFKNTLLNMLSGEVGESLSARCLMVAQNASRPEIENFAKRVAKWSDNPTHQNLDELISLLVGVRKESWTDERISEGYEKLQNLCVQFKRYETFSNTAVHSSNDTLPVSLIYRDLLGNISEFEQFVDAKSVDDKRFKDIKSAMDKELASMNTSERVAVLMQMLASEMLPIEGSK